MKIKTNLRAGSGGTTSGLDSSTSSSTNSGGVNSGGVNSGGGKTVAPPPPVYTRCAGY